MLRVTSQAWPGSPRVTVGAKPASELPVSRRPVGGGSELRLAAGPGDSSSGSDSELRAARASDSDSEGARRLGSPPVIMTHWQDDHARTHDCRSMMMMIHEHDFRNLKPDSESHSTTSTSSSTGTVTMISSAARAAAVPPRPQARAGAAQWHCRAAVDSKPGLGPWAGAQALCRPASQLLCYGSS